jgi:apolipoprotein N-acyltransferase
MIFNKIFRHKSKESTLKGDIGASMVFFILSTVLVTFAQIDWSALSCILSSACGYALFWIAIRALPPFYASWCALVWFGGISLIHVNWFLSFRYGDPLLISIVFTLFFFAKGAAFQLLTYFREKSSPLQLASMCVISEWLFSKFLFYTGCPIDPIGLPLSATTLGMQGASLFGILGLSFWVILTNAYGYQLFKNRTLKNAAIFALLTLTPYLF